MRAMGPLPRRGAPNGGDGSRRHQVPRPACDASRVALPLAHAGLLNYVIYWSTQSASST